MPSKYVTLNTSSRVLFKNVNVFDGVTNELKNNVDVLVDGNIIRKIGSVDSTDGAQVIDGSGKTLMPGLIEGHGHLALAKVSPGELIGELPSYTSLVAAAHARDMLMMGFTGYRDLAGEVFGLKRAIDEELFAGPRIFPSGALISQTSGHGDFRTTNEHHPSCGGHVPAISELRHAVLADGSAQVFAAVREQLRLGASQIKLCISGGGASPTDPIDVTEFTKEEVAAAVAAAENWGTYVCVHGYTPRAVNMALDAGVKVIEHGQLLDEPTLTRMMNEGIWLSTQPFLGADDPNMNPVQRAKMEVVSRGTARVYEFIKKNPKLKVVHGTDCALKATWGKDREVEHMESLLKWLTPFEVLKMTTSNVGELAKLSGPRNPYPNELGVIKEGAYADLLLVNGNPLEDLKMVTRADNLRLVMKDGKIYKNTL